ncbi:MAG: transglycosylase SLT domain-containing protein [Desulfobacteraceae bacterium]|jgi:membrane-bound lytic murein transglycosylase D
MKIHHLISKTMVLLILGSLLLFGAPSAASELFPAYPCIEPNVLFWIEAYSNYSTAEGIIHDSNNLNIIYDVIELWPPEKHGSRKVNRKRIKKAKKKYKRILSKLAKNSSTQDPEARIIAGLFGPNAGPADFRKAMYNIRCQIGQRDRFVKGLIRSGAYIDEIKEIFRSEGLPEDLAYLPHVESSFNPEAYSKFGAAGIWQFTRSTGRRFMTIGYAMDERRDPMLSSRAAAKLLKQNYEKLGNWPMAITAYNHGVTGMLRAKRAKDSYEEIFKHYRRRRFKFASRNFYAEFLAAREVAKNYGRYFGLLQLDKPLDTREVLLEGYTTITDLSRHFQVDMETIQRLNPALRRPVLKNQKYVPKGYALRLPADSVEGKQVASAEILESLYRLHQKPSRFYRVKRGDTVGEIAHMHGLKVSDLIMANNLDSRATIYINQNLRLPLPGEKLERVESTPKISPQLASASQAQPREVAVIPPENKPSLFEGKTNASDLPVTPAIVVGNLEIQHVMTEDGRQIGVIRVELEETLGHYADWLGVPTWAIRRLNGFPYGKLLRIHQKVKIPLDKVSREQFEQARIEFHQELQEDFFSAYKIESVQIYRVKNGDSIWTLCNEVFKLPLWLVKKYNPDVDFYNLRRSQKLAIPVVERRGEASSDESTEL